MWRWLADINAKGGVLGQRLVLEVGEDACNPKQAVSVANTMVNKKIVFMHGHGCSSRGWRRSSRRSACRSS
ncbi:MAG TPA: ABC transporter substrate-binding protein [Rubrivivax sp.]|nr:ABC transporter substrate-binding protein [Rubrivivax sp.]